MSRQSKYWAKRFAQLEEAQHASSEAKAGEIERQFKEAERTIQNQISEWYVRFADENGEISITKAKKLLNSKELEELRWDVNEYIKYGEENALNQKWMHELENASAKAHINRLEALKLRIQAEGEKLYGSVEDGVKKHIKKQYKDSYYHTAYEIAKGSGVGVNFAAVNEKKLEAIINKPWAADGKNFAVRLGESKAQLIDNVYKSLVQMTLTGENPDKAISMLSKTMDGDKKRAARIIMTESAYFTELANKESYKELGVEQYEIIATLDSHTSEICQQMDGKVFDLKDMEPGVTAPPFHPNCRSCTAPYYDDSEFENDEDFKSFIGERAARDEEGKYYTVPANTTYKEWYKGFVEQNEDYSQLFDIASDAATQINSSSKRRKVPENEDNFETFNNTNKPVIKPRRIINEMKKSDIGRETLEYLKANNVQVRLYSGVDNPEGLCGLYDPFDDIIVVYCDKCENRVEMAKTVIHETVHRKCGSTNTFEEEVECYVAEFMHDHDELTETDRENIIKMVRKIYHFG